MQVIADSDEPVLHIYAEGSDLEVSSELESEMRTLVDGIIGAEAGAAAPSSAA